MNVLMYPDVRRPVAVLLFILQELVMSRLPQLTYGDFGSDICAGDGPIILFLLPCGLVATGSLRLGDENRR